MDRNVLLAADRVADRRSGDRGADIEISLRLQLLVVKGVKVPSIVPVKTRPPAVASTPA
jgi:hypothetical protein